jgi:hypothetical protein
MTPDGATLSVSSILLSPNGTAELAELQQQLDDTKKELAEVTLRREYFKNALEDARKFPQQLKGVMERLFSDALDEDLPLEADAAAMYQRLVQLVADDKEHDVWNPLRDYDVTMTYIVTVTGRVRAKNEEDAEQLARDDEPEFKFSWDGALEDSNLSWDLDEVRCDEA